MVSRRRSRFPPEKHPPYRQPLPFPVHNQPASVLCRICLLTNTPLRVSCWTKSARQINGCKWSIGIDLKGVELLEICKRYKVLGRGAQEVDCNYVGKIELQYVARPILRHACLKVSQGTSRVSLLSIGCLKGSFSTFGNMILGVQRRSNSHVGT